MTPVSKAILFKLSAVVFFIGMATFVKVASERIPPGEAVFFRAFCGIPVLLTWILISGELRTALVTRNPIGHFWRGFVGTMAMGMGFAALGFLPLSEVKAIQYAQPVLVVVFAAMFLGEVIRVFRMTAVFMGLAGVLIIMWPRLTVLQETDFDPTLTLGAVLAFSSAVLAGLSHVFIRKLTKKENTIAIVFYFALTASCLSLITVPFGWVMPIGMEWFWLIGAGIFGAAGQICLTSSYKGVDVSVVAPFEYVSILLALIIGYFAFSEVPTAPMLIGIALIVAAGVLIIWRERQLGLERAEAKKASTPQG